MSSFSVLTPKDLLRVKRSTEKVMVRLESKLISQLVKHQEKKQALQDARLRELRSKGLLEFL